MSDPMINDYETYCIGKAERYILELESKLALAMQIIEKLEEIQSELIAVAELHADHTFEKINQIEELKKGLR